MRSLVFPFLAAGFDYTSMGDEDTISGSDIRLGGGLILAPKDYLGVVIEIGYHILTLTHDVWVSPDRVIPSWLDWVWWVCCIDCSTRECILLTARIDP
jgi:hypothetical protein